MMPVNTAGFGSHASAKHWCGIVLPSSGTFPQRPGRPLTCSHYALECYNSLEPLSMPLSDTTVPVADAANEQLRVEATRS